MEYQLVEPPDVVWSAAAILVYNIWFDEFTFFPDKAKTQMLFSSPSIEDFDEFSEEHMPFDCLCEMIKLARLVKERIYWDSDQKQTQLDNFNG